MKRFTNFFVAQRYYTRMSQLFYGLFVLVVCLQFLFVLLLVGVVTYLFTGVVQASLLLWVCGFLAGFFVLGAVIGQQKTRQGGMSIAKQMHAVRLFIQQDHHQPAFTTTFIRVAHPRQLPASYRRYYEFAEQLSIASGVPLPRLYVLPFEQAVNGFVAGFDVHDTVMVLTQGAVDKLTNAELYGLLGHEFGHIVHGDARLNLKIYAYLTMLNWIHDLADVLEEGIFGKFDKNYHDKYHSAYSLTTPISQTLGQDKRAWISYLTKERQAIEQSLLHTHTTYSDWFYKDNEVYLFLVYLVMALPVVLLRFLGVVGMASAEWIKGRFNHQREFLADATSVQLTRSPDVVDALVCLKARHDTALQSQAFTTGMSHFFFANPKPLKDNFAYSHPKIDERIESLTCHDYDEFGKQMVVDINKQKLSAARQFVKDYTYLFDDEMLDEQEHDDLPSKDELAVMAFVPEPEVVIDGRLVVDTWQEPVIKESVYPQQASFHTAIEMTFDASTQHLPNDFMQNIHLPWQMVKALRKLTGTLALIESVLLCRQHQKLTLGDEVNLCQIYRPNITTSAWILPHKLPDELLLCVARFDRRLDGRLVVISLRRLLWHIQNLPINYQTLVNQYHTGLGQLLAIDKPLAVKLTNYQSFEFDHSLLTDKKIQGEINVLYQAAVMATIWQILDKQVMVLPALQEYRQQLLVWLKLDVYHQTAACILLLLLFLVGVQDNSLYLRQYEKMLYAVKRWCLSLQLELTSDDDGLITLMHQTWVLDDMDWLVLILGIKSEQTQLILETLCTALVYDGVLGQMEYDLLAVFSVLWQGEMPRV